MAAIGLPGRDQVRQRLFVLRVRGNASLTTANVGMSSWETGARLLGDRDQLEESAAQRILKVSAPGGAW